MNKITKEDKELKLKEYKDMFLVLYRIFGGIITKKHFKELCLKYNYFTNEDSFNKTIAQLEDYDLIEVGYIAGSELQILRIKQFAVDYLEGKRARGIKLTTDKVIESYMKYSIISKNKALNNIKDIRLNEFYNIIIKNTTFWSKEKSPVSINEWLENKYTFTQEGYDAKERGTNFEKNRNKNLNSNDADESVSEKKALTALDYMEIKTDKKTEYTQSIDFSKIRNRGGFINDLPSLSHPKPDTLRIETLVTSKEAPDFKNLGAYIYDSIYLASQQLDNIKHLYINLSFIDAKQIDVSFNSCFEYGRDERGILRDKRNVIDKINNYSKSKMSISFKPFKQALDREKYSAVLGYKLRFGNEDVIKDREIFVYLTFKHRDVYKELYGAEKAEAMIAISKSRAEERKEERKNKDRVINTIIKLDKNGNLDKIEKLVTELNNSEIDKLIKFVKSM